MSNFVRNSLYAAALLVVSFLGVILYASRQMPVMTAASKNVLAEFFARIEAKNYEGARQLLVPNIQEEVTVEELRAKWQKFEAENGSFQKWAPADADSSGGGRICLWPPYVDYFTRVSGTKDDAVLFFRVSPQAEGWKIERYSEFRKNPMPTAPKNE